MEVAAVDSSALRPSSNTVHQRATDRVTFTAALTSAFWPVCRLGGTFTSSPAPDLLTLRHSLSDMHSVKGSVTH